MPIKVVNEKLSAILAETLTPPHTIKIFGNDVTPVGTNVAGDFIEIAGGGYANKPIIFANWNIVTGAPSIATYNTSQEWIFTGAINAPGTIYGYYITRNSDGKLLLVQRFPSGSVPFVPVAGSRIVVLPRLTAQSLF